MPSSIGGDTTASSGQRLTRNASASAERMGIWPQQDAEVYPFAPWQVSGDNYSLQQK